MSDDSRNEGMSDIETYAQHRCQCSACRKIDESRQPDYRAAHAEGFRRGVQAAAELVESWTRTHPKEWAAAQIRALRPEGE